MNPDEPPAYHHEWLCEKLEALANRDIMRAAFSMHPGAAKTSYCSRLFPAFYLGRNPHHKWLHAGHSQEFAEQQFGAPTRDIIQSSRYAEVFPEVQLASRNAAAGSWKLGGGARGAYVCKGVGQKIAGYRGNCGGGDDLLGSREDAHSPTIREKVNKWMFTDFRTRFLPKSPIFLVATRWHPEDVIGHVIKLNSEGRGIPWEIYNINAVIETEQEMAEDPLGRSLNETMWPDFYDYETLMDLKNTLPEQDWFALYKGKPTKNDGAMVSSGWFGRDEEIPPREKWKRVTVSVDTAEKTTERSKYSVVQVWIETHDRTHHLVDSDRRKVGIVELIPMIENMARNWGASVILIEDAGAGTQYIQLRRGKAPCSIISVPKPQNEKSFRFDGVTPMIEAGEVFIPKSAPWLSEYVNELLMFPTGTYSDQVDATSQYLDWAKVKHRYGTKRMRGAA